MDDDAQMTKVAKNRRSTAVGTHDIHYLKHCVSLGGRWVVLLLLLLLVYSPSRASNRLTAPQNPAGAVKQRDHFWAAA